LGIAETATRAASTARQALSRIIKNSLRNVVKKRGGTLKWPDVIRLHLQFEEWLDVV
jgi:hypothetical protein